jgi:hypothetical protein
MAQSMPWLRPAVIGLILARCLHSWWLMAAFMLAQSGVDDPLGLSNAAIDRISNFSTLQTVTWVSYIIGYVFTAWLVYRRRALALPIVLVTVSLDVLYWVAISNDPNMFQLTQLVELGVYGLRDLLINLAGLAVAFGVFMLKQMRELH